MNEINFRQPLFHNSKFDHWHYWGFIGNEFIGPIHGTLGITLKQAQKDSQQYTGREDRDGKKIYKGDVFDVDDGKRIDVVIWRDLRAMWDVKVVEIPVGKDYSFFVIESHEWSERCRIIGNATENPELLLPRKAEK